MNRGDGQRKPVMGALWLTLITFSQLIGCSYTLMSAAVDGDTKTVLAQLDEGVDVNIGFPLVATRALILAAAHGRLETARTLLDRGADVNAADITGWTPLHAAAYKGNPEIIRLLLERGAVAPPPTWYRPSPLSVAKSLHHTAAVEVLKRVELAPPRPEPAQ
jgi:ankyrin repeat protein